MAANKTCAVFSGRAAEDVHHLRGRAGTLLIDRRFFKAVSRKGHRWIDANREEARKRGLLCQRGEWGKAPDDEETRRLKEIIRNVEHG